MIDIDAIVEEAERMAACPSTDWPTADTMMPATNAGAALRLTLGVLSDLVFKDRDTLLITLDPSYNKELQQAVRVLEVSNMCTLENYNSNSIIVRRVRNG